MGLKHRDASENFFTCFRRSRLTFLARFSPALVHMLSSPHASFITFLYGMGNLGGGEQPSPLSSCLLTCVLPALQSSSFKHSSQKQVEKNTDHHMLQNMHQDFRMAWLHCELPKSLETKLNTLLSTVPMDQSAFLSSDKHCPLSLMISPVHVGEESNEILRQENRGKHHSPSSECSLWPCCQPAALHLTGQWEQRNAEVLHHL